jgi:hypothetical protein
MISIERCRQLDAVVIMGSPPLVIGVVPRGFRRLRGRCMGAAQADGRPSRQSSKDKFQHHSPSESQLDLGLQLGLASSWRRIGG